MTVSIRPAAQTDLPALDSLWQQFNAHLDTVTIPENIDPALFDRFEALCFGPTRRCEALIAEVDGGPAGYLVYFFGVRMNTVAPVLFIADIFVSETARGNGAGSALMHAARKIALESSSTGLIWNVARANTQAIDFYRRIGAIEMDDMFMFWAVEGNHER